MREYKIARLSEPLPDLEGRLFDPDNEDFCARLEYAPIDSYVWDAAGYRPEARAYVAYDDAGLHVLMCAHERTINAEVKQFNGEVYRDSCLEFFLQPFEDDARYLNIEINAAGAALIGVGTDRFDRQRLPQPPEGMDICVSRHRDGWWAVAYVIPAPFIREIYGRVPAPGSEMRGNFYKCDESIHPHFGTWAPVVNFQPDFHLPEWFGRLYLDASGA